MESKNNFKPKFAKPKFNPKFKRDHGDRGPGPHKFKKRFRGGDKILTHNVETKFFKQQANRKNFLFSFAEKQSKKAEILLNEDEGFIVADYENGEESTLDFTQDDILKSEDIDISSATKSFKLNLNDFGPYKISYTRNGRHLLLGGKKGHIASIDWISKKISCEFSVMEEVHDVKWLHLETMFAVAQKKWVHFYDNKGTETHCVKKMHDVNQLEFLPYHFLLVSGSNDGWLKWLDVTMGEIVSEYRTIDEKVNILKQNPSNAVVCTGNSKGVVCMYSPAIKGPLARILCHPTPITALAFNPSGRIMATSGIDRKLKLWDTRMFREPLTSYQTRTPVNNISVSQKNVVAVALGNNCEIFRYSSLEKEHSLNPYMRNIEDGAITDLEFVPYEDVLGIGSRGGFSSILVPGSGEPNFDTMEQNPFRTKKQRREHEVKAILEKIPHELITLQSSQIMEVDVDQLKERFEDKKEFAPVQTPSQKSQTKMSGIQKSKIKQTVSEHSKQQLLKAKKIEELEARRKSKATKKTSDEQQGALDRFKK